MKIKKQSLYNFFFIFLFAIIFSKNTLSADYDIYLNIYNSCENLTFQNESIEILYLLLNKIGNLFNLSYNQFLFFYAFAGLSLIFNTVKKYASKTNWVMYAYFLFPYFSDIVQVRNFFAYAIVIYGIRYLMEKDSSKIKYIICIVIALGFHKLSIVYLVFFLTLFKIENLKKIIFIMIPIEMIVLGNDNFITNLVLSMGDKYEIYLNNPMSFKNMIFFSLLVIGNFFIVYFVMKYKDNVNVYDSIILKIAFISLLFIIPIMLLGNNFYRVFRNIMPLFYICFSNFTFSFNNKNESLLKVFKVGLYIYPIILFLFLSDFNDAVIPIIKSLI